MTNNFTYFQGLPNRNNKPSIDQPNMTINNNSNLGIWAVDHTGFNNGNNTDGYHTIIHQIPVNSSPTTIQNISQIYPKPVTPAYSGAPTQLQLFFKSAFTNSASAAPESQLTGYIANTSTPFNGWQWLGGVLIQWGFQATTFPSQTQAVVFTANSQGIPFPNNLFNVQVTLQATSTGGPSGGNWPQSSISPWIDTLNYSKTGFTVNISPNSSRYKGFYWLAIGN